MFDRHPNADSTTNLRALLNVLEGPLGRQVTLFVTSPQPDIRAGYSEADGTVLPLVAAVGKHECVGLEMKVVFDGRFLSAADRAEIEELLDVAVVSGRAWFSRVPAPFTSMLQPENAVLMLLGSMHAGVSRLTAETRAEFMQLLRWPSRRVA